MPMVTSVCVRCSFVFSPLSSLTLNRICLEKRHGLTRETTTNARLCIHM